MKITDLWYLFAWSASSGITYLLFTETNSSKLKKENPAVYNDLQANPDSLKTKITEEETSLATLKAEHETKKKSLVSADDSSKQIIEEELKNQAEELVKKGEIVSLYKSIDSFGLKMPTLSLTNIGKSLGIFLLLGLAFQFATNKILQIFKKNNE